MRETAPTCGEDLAEHIKGVKFTPLRHSWKRVYWTTLEVIFDGYRDDGERIHIVKGSLLPRIIRGALVFGQKEYEEAKEYFSNESF